MATYTRQSSAGIVDGGVIEASDLNNEFNQLASAFLAPTFGVGTAGTDIVMTFDGETNDGVITWMEDEDYFKFSDDIMILDNEQLIFGTDSNVAISYDETTTDSLKIAATEGAGLAITLMADEGDDAGDEWKLNVADGGTITLGNDIASAGTFVTHLTLTPNSTITSSLANFAGEVQMVTLDIGGTNVTTTAAELNLIDGGTARGTTAVASGDGILINDDGTMRMTNVDTVSTYFASHNVGGSSVVTTGALDSGSITSGFGAIDNGTSGIRTNTFTAETSIIPDAAGGADIGSTSAEWGDVYIADDKYIKFGNDQNVIVGYDEDGDDSLEFTANVEGAALAFTYKADEGDDNADIWKQNFADGGTITWQNKTSGSFATKLTLDTGGNLNIAGELQTTNIGYTDGDNAMTIADGGAVTFAQVPVFPDDTVETADIQDNAVTLAKMAGLARGKIIYGDSSGDPAALAVGSANYFLKSDGTDISWAAAPATALDDIATGDAASTLATSAGNITIDAQGDNTDIIFKGTDGTVDTTFLTLDGSEAGKAIFNAGITIADAGTIGSASDADAIAIASDGVVTMNQIPVFSAGINVSGGTIAGTLATAAQTNITSLGTLTALTVDDVAVNGKVITMTGSTSDTAVFTAGTDGTLTIETTDAAAAAANIQITADGTAELAGTTVTLDSGADIVLDAAGNNVTFKSGGTAILDFSNSSSDAVITSSVQDKDIIFKGDDGGSAVTPLTMDMSAAGKSIFGAAAVGSTLTDTSNTGSITLDFDTYQNFVLTFTGNVTLANPSTESAGQSGVIVIIQDGTGSRTLATGDQFEWPGGSVGTISTSANAIDVVPYFVSAAGSIKLGAPQLAFAST